MNYFVTGIGTEVGKTVASAILVQALKADYWKPVQCGDLDNSDSMKIEQWVKHPTHVFPEQYRLTRPMSPHAAAEKEGVHIDLNKMQLPKTDRRLIVEGAGGLMVPLNQDDLMLDLIRHLKIPTFVISRHYLGSINHTLLTIEMLKKNQIPIQGLFFNGPENKDTESIISRFIGPELILGRIDELTTIDSDSVALAAEAIKPLLNMEI